MNKAKVWRNDNGYMMYKFPSSWHSKEKEEFVFTHSAVMGKTYNAVITEAIVRGKIVYWREECTDLFRFFHDSAICPDDYHFLCPCGSDSIIFHQCDFRLLGECSVCGYLGETGF